MRRTSRWVSIFFASLVVGILLGGAVAGFLYFNRGPARYLSSGEASYQAGINAVKDGRYTQAQTSFHEAILSADNLLREYDDPSTEQRPPEQYEKEQRLLGQAHWIKHRAVKARGFTKLLIEKKPLPTFEGQAEGTPDQVLQRLSTLRLPDDETRREALTSLREAAYRLPGNADVLREAIATEIQIEPLQWNYIHAFATTLFELDPSDERAHYLVARLEYEQPVAIKSGEGTATMPMPHVKRSRDRMLKGIEIVSKLKTKEQPIRWRTLYLEAQMYAWLGQYYHQPTQNKPDAEREAQQQLRTILFDPEKGVLHRTQLEEKLSVTSKLDLQGLFGLHQMAIETTIEESRRQTSSALNPDAQRPWTEQLQKQMDACLLVVNKTKAPGRMTEVADFLVQACLKTMPYLAASRPEVWADYRNQALELTKAARQENRINPTLTLRIADLLTKEGQWQQQAGDKAVARTRLAEAAEWLEIGLKSIAKATSPVALSLHEAKLRLLSNDSQPLTSLQPHLAVLRESKQENAIAAAAYYEGITAEREGRLQQARQMLEQAAHSSRTDLNRKAMTRLVPIYLTLELPDQALSTLNELNRIFTRLDGMSAEERTWFYSMIRNPDELLGDQVQAHIQAAHLANHQIHDDKTPTADHQALLARHEAEIKKLLGKPVANPAITARMRLAWAQYLLQWDRFDEAQPLLMALKQSHPDSLQTLQLEIGYFLGKAQTTDAKTTDTGLPKPLVDQIDALIQDYNKRQNANQAGKLVWLKWLSNTSRADQARRLIEDPAFLGIPGKDPSAERLRAMAHLYVGNREQSHAILKALASDPQVDVALLQVAHSISEQQNVLASAMQHHQDSGLFRTWSAALALAKGDHAEACRGFINCLEYSRVRPLVRQGLTDAMIGWSQYQPAEARKLAIEALQQYPSESSLLLGYAIASLQMGELGSPADNSDQVKDMATALKAFEAACAQEHRDPSIAPWVEAQCWLLSPRRDLARLQALRVIDVNPKHEAAYILAIQLLLEQNNNTCLQQAYTLSTLFQKNLPTSVEAFYWQARCLDQQGKPNDALALYRQVMEQSPRHPGVYSATCLLLLKQPNIETYTACLQVLHRWKAALPDDLLSIQMEARLLAQQGKLSESRATLDRCLAALESKVQGSNAIQTVSTEKQQQLARQKADAICLISQGILQANQQNEAEAWLQRALEIAPDHEPAHLLLGNVAMDQMRHLLPNTEARKAAAQKAVSAFSSVYRRNPTQTFAGNNIAWLLCTELNDPAEAYRIMQEVRMRKHYARPMSGDLLSVEMLDTLGKIYHKLARPDYAQEQIDLFEAARRRYSEEPRIAACLAQGYLTAGDGKRALQTFQAARNLIPKSNLDAEVLTALNQQIQQGISEAQSKSR